MDGIPAQRRFDRDGDSVTDWARETIGFTPVLPTTFRVEAVSCRAISRHHIAWADLCSRALEPNVFLEPAFALPLMQHVSPQDRPDILLVWAEGDPLSFSRLIGLLPLTIPRRSPLRRAGGYTDKHVALGTPLLDRDIAAEAFDAMLAWLRHRDRPIPSLVLTAIATAGPFHALVKERCDRDSLQCRALDANQRAILRRDHPSIVGSLASAKRRKEWRRQSRRLSDAGTRTYASARTPKDIARAVERFLALEHNGWKGGRSTSLLADPRVATFTRSMCRLMAHEDKCRIEAIEIDGKAVAMGIILIVDDRAHFWKTAFDERFAACSPGVQFTTEMTDRLLADPTIMLTDSCAKPDHSMIDRLWCDRTEMADLMIGTMPGDLVLFEQAWRLERVCRSLRAAAKYLGRRLLNRTH